MQSDWTSCAWPYLETCNVSTRGGSAYSACPKWGHLRNIQFSPPHPARDQYKKDCLFILRFDPAGAVDLPSWALQLKNLHSDYLDSLEWWPASQCRRSCALQDQNVASFGEGCCRNPAMLVGSPLGVQAPPSFHPMQHVLSSIESCPPCPERNFQSSCLAICHPLKILVLNREENPHEFNMWNKSLISVGFNPCESGSLPKLLRCSEWTCPTNA